MTINNFIFHKLKLFFFFFFLQVIKWIFHVFLPFVSSEFMSEPINYISERSRYSNYISKNILYSTTFNPYGFVIMVLVVFVYFSHRLRYSL